MSISRFYLDDVVTECVRSLRSVASSRSIEIRCESDSDLIIGGDEELIQHLIQNLVENAVKFSTQGGSVVVSARRSEESYVVRVTDSGAGIAPADQPFIFDRFFRATRTASGAGLGLAIARWIADAHGATLVLERSGANGSTFAVTFPQTERTQPRLARVAEGES